MRARTARRLRDWCDAYALPGIVLGAHVLLFALARGAILLVYPDDFSTVPANLRAAALLRGFRFDAAVLCPGLGPPLLMLLLPWSWARTLRWQQIWGWACFGVFLGFAFILASDAVYFGYVHRHAGVETAQAAETLKAVSTSAVRAYPWALAGFVALAAILGWAWSRALNRPPPATLHRGVQAAIAALALVCLYFGERGTLSGKRLRMVHAFQDLPEPAAQLALNGPYCILHTLIHAKAVTAEFYPWKEALAAARDMVFAPAEVPSDPAFPLLRSRPAGSAERPNVVLIMLESWDASAVDAHRRQRDLAPLGFTPSYDALSREGVLFSRFYACGQRSMDGMSALLSGFPTLPGLPYLGQGLELSGLTGLGALGRQEGYDTWFIQASERDSFRCDAIAPRLGFDHYLGAEDIPEDPPGRPRAILRGACWDHEMFAEAARRLSSSRRPFLAFLYTASTHPPFAWPEDRWKKRPGDGLDARYLNSLGYADWALGEFFARAKAAGWFERTVFVVTADHLGGPASETSAGHPESRHHIPCLVLAPGLAPGVDRRIGSQLDVLPTIEELAGWRAPHAALGCSLRADPAAGRGALCVEGNLVLRVEEGGFVLHDLSARVAEASFAEGGNAGAIERRLLSLVQTGYTLLRTNRIGR
jgi:hypothetical protein